MTTLLTSSEMRAWQTCPRGWWLRYYRRLRRTHEYASLPSIGSLVHAGLEPYYRGEVLDPPQFIRAELDALIAQNPELADLILKDGELAVIMLEGYMEEVERSGMDADYEYVGAEVAVEHHVGPYVLRGKLDARLRRLSDGALLQLEHKTVASFPDLIKTAQSNPQFLTYDLLAYLTKPDGAATDGVLLNMLRRVKRTARANPPFYHRHEVRHNLDELRAHYRHVVAIGDQITAVRKALDSGVDHHDVTPPAIGKEHGWENGGCPCKDITPMIDDGGDVEGYLAEWYETYDPDARYKEELK